MNAGSLTAGERDAVWSLSCNRVAVEILVISHEIYSFDISPIFQVIDECNKAENWLQEKTQQQDLLPKNVDPVLWSCEIKRKAEGFDAYCSHILRLAIFISAVEPNYLVYFTFSVLCYRVVYIQYLNSIMCWTFLLVDLISCGHCFEDWSCQIITRTKIWQHVVHQVMIESF